MRDFAELSNKTILVVGVGGLGGFVVDEIVRLGIGEIILIDQDTFSQSNINRQLLANVTTIGKSKVQEYAKWIANLSACQVKIHQEFLTKDNLNYLDGVDIVIDCVDNVATKLLLAKACQQKRIVLIHGGIEGLQGQVMICTPDKDALGKMMKNSQETTHSTCSYAVATIAAMQVNLAMKVLQGNHELDNKLIIVDLQSMGIEIVNI